MALPDLISALDAAVARAQGSTGARRKALLPYVLQHGLKAADERDALVERLEKGWSWLAANHDQPESETDRWIGLLRDYERLCDALTRAEECL